MIEIILFWSGVIVILIITTAYGIISWNYIEDDSVLASVIMSIPFVCCGLCCLLIQLFGGVIPT